MTTHIETHVDPERVVRISVEADDFLDSTTAYRLALLAANRMMQVSGRVNVLGLSHLPSAGIAPGRVQYHYRAYHAD